ncbi:MAG: AAA family ATPase [Clostridia bacterium]|nr:AAA family ATPase [Clostridia bacterium]
MDIDELKKQIAELPTGGITVKKIPKKNTEEYYEYTVYQWFEGGKQRSRYLKGNEIQEMTALIEKRKYLEEQLRHSGIAPAESTSAFITNVQTGKALRELTKSVAGLKKREIIHSLENYVFGNEYNRVFILYGLRRTGKTTMIKQVISEMTEEQFSKTAFIQVSTSDDLGKLNRDLRRLFDGGYRYVFLDEVTLLEDFIEGAALFSDIYAASGMKVVLSGTDSLGFWISKSEELFDRCRILHTTFIPYREFENVLGIRGIDTYIQFGGTMSMSGNHYNTFACKSDTDEYVDSAIAHNIQHSLKCYQNEGHFRHLYSLYEKNELTSAINRVVEDINHRFTVNVLTREFKSGDLSLSARNLRSENDVLDRIDRDAVTARLKELLEIKNKSEQTVEIDSVHEFEIKEYLTALDLIRNISIADIDAFGKYEMRTAFTQAGLRYSQAKSLVDALMRDEVFSTLSFADRKYVTERILNEIKGRMLEDIILLETALANPDKEIFKLQFMDGEYDMVVFDSQNGGCSIFEIKYSSSIEEKQYRHLVDPRKTEKTEFRYGEIRERCVLYRGENAKRDTVQYLNVEDYLKSLCAPDVHR